MMLSDLSVVATSNAIPPFLPVNNKIKLQNLFQMPPAAGYLITLYEICHSSMLNYINSIECTTLVHLVLFIVCRNLNVGHGTW